LSTTITTADLNVTDVDNATAQFTFHVGTTHGHVALSGRARRGDLELHQAQLAAGSVIFVQVRRQNPAANSRLRYRCA